jgi:hypothetical protein
MFHVIARDHKSVCTVRLLCSFDQVELRLASSLAEDSDGTHQCGHIVILQQSGCCIDFIVVGSQDGEALGTCACLSITSAQPHDTWQKGPSHTFRERTITS